MKIRVFLAGAILLAMASSSFAVSPEYTEWASGPAQYLMTREEAADWKAVSTDEAAKAFVDLFWARRDPTPETPANEFRQEFDSRVAYADEKLGFGSRRGSMTDRGRMYILFGAPKRVEQRSAQMTMDRSDAQTEDRASQNWIYEGDAAKEMFGASTATLTFSDRLGNGDFRLQRGRVDTRSAQDRVVARAITQPALKQAPSFQAGASAPAAAAAAPAPANATALSNEALQRAVAEFKAAKPNPFEKTVFINWGEYVTVSGEVFTPVMLYVSKETGLTAGQELTFFGVVEDESGKVVGSVEKPLVVAATGDDFFADTSMVLPGGKLKGYFGLADGDKPVAMASASMDLAGTLDKDAPATSQLILSNNIFPLEQAPAPTDPFTFGGMKVIPKGSRVFTPKDELWYFFTVRNPALPAVAAAGAEGVAEAVTVPKLQVAIDVEGKDAAGKKLPTKRMPLSEVAAVPMLGSAGHYGVGSSMMLETFAPGTYTLKIRVIDTVGKKTWNLSESFRVAE